jgi:hypothetical protein
MSRNMNVNEEEDGVYIEDDFGGRARRSKWGGTIEQLHTWLAQHGLKKTRRQPYSNIGGEYQRSKADRDWTA